MDRLQEAMRKLETRLRRMESSYPRQQGGLFKPTTGTYRVLPADVLNPDGSLALNVSKIHSRGAIPPTSNTPSFGVTANNSSATIYWDGTNGSSVIVVRRSDGTSSTIPPGSITVTGLSPSTTYYALPYWAPDNRCGLSWVPGSAGSPAILTTTTFDDAQIAKLVRLGNEQIATGPFSFATTASSSPSGVTTTRPPGCVMLGTDIEPVVESWTWTADHIPHTEWIHLVAASGRSLYCTPDHPLYLADGNRVNAEDLLVGDWVVTVDGDQELLVAERHRRVCTKLRVTMPTGHLFWANGFLSHNMKITNPSP